MDNYKSIKNKNLAKANKQTETLEIIQLMIVEEKN